MKKAIHAYAVNGKTNSGDFFLGPATKWHFEKNIAKEKVEWTNMDVRSNFSEKEADYVNGFDYFVVGGGGLMLPDTNENNISRWQWPVSNEALRKIKTPLYVLGVGYNLFHGQTVGNSENNSCPRYKTFKSNMETLIDVSEHFSLRHNGDCERLKEVIDSKYHSSVKFEFCPTIEYSKNYLASNNDIRCRRHIPRDIYAFEIKDDRPERRYFNLSREDFYKSLKDFILHLLSLNKKVCVLSHDGSSSFKSYLDNNNVKVNFITNTVASEREIIFNYLKIKKLFCTAGHSQMMGYALGCEIISMITHDKLKYFLEDINQYTEDKYIDVNYDNVYEKLIRHAE